jgi:hypothetical protein
MIVYIFIFSTLNMHCLTAIQISLSLLYIFSLALQPSASYGLLVHEVQ